MSKIGLRGGHSKNCRGAHGVVDEWETMQKLFPMVKARLENRGHQVIDCNSNASTESAELAEGTNKSNNNRCNYYFTLHMNAHSNSSATGVECLVYESGDKPVNRIAKDICNNISNIFGLANRGVKCAPKDHDLACSSMPAIIIEVGFCTNPNDVNKLVNHMDALADCIVNGICGTPNNVTLNPQKKVEERKNFQINVTSGFSLHRYDVSGVNSVTLDPKNGETLESIAIQIQGFNFEYRVNISGCGRDAWSRNGFVHGCYNNGHGIEGIEIHNYGEPPYGYQIRYQVHNEGKGWSNWCKDGEYAGLENNGATLVTAVKIEVVKIA